jgi:hypothetical protein
MSVEPDCDVPAYGIVVEKDVDVPIRDGAWLKADVLRPDDAGKFPAILNLGPYQKDKLWVPPDSLEEQPNPLMNNTGTNTVHAGGGRASYLLLPIIPTRNS